MSKVDFIKKIGPIVKEVAEEKGYSDVMICTCIAQACVESGYGTSDLMMKANALFGIKATKAWKGKVFSAKTKECYDSKNTVTITDCFRAYGSVRESVVDYFKLVSTKRYKACLTEKTVLAAIQDIKDGGYATAVNYVTTVNKVFTENRALIESYAHGDFVETTKFEKDYDAIARDVIAGKYGNGIERMYLLGADYAKVQSAVNKILKGAKK